MLSFLLWLHILMLQERSVGNLGQYPKDETTAYNYQSKFFPAFLKANATLQLPTWQEIGEKDGVPLTGNAVSGSVAVEVNGNAVTVPSNLQMKFAPYSCCRYLHYN